MLITGGSQPNSGQYWPILASAELFDPDTGTFSATGDMTTPRSGHTATILQDGRVLIVVDDRNLNEDDPRHTTEIYDPSTGVFTATGAMVMLGNATLLNNGKVLITGSRLNFLIPRPAR